MKKTLIILFVLGGFFATAQSPNATIEKQFLEYSRLVIDKNIDAALDYTNPGVFEIMPRESMKSLMESVFNMPSIEYKAEMPTVSGFEPVLVKGDERFVRFKSHTDLQMKIKEEEELSASEKKSKQAMLLMSFENKFGKGNVVYDEKTDFYKIKSTKTVVASSDASMTDWKFVVVENPRMKAMLEKFIPAELLD